jgi:hypothetical protein
VTLIAENCEDVAFLETGTATFQLTTLKYFTKTYGLEGLIVPAEASGDFGTAIGYDLQWCNGIETIADIAIPCLVACCEHGIHDCLSSSCSLRPACATAYGRLADTAMSSTPFHQSRRLMPMHARNLSSGGIQ